MPSSVIPNTPNQSQCRYCSVISQANGEDPIGTAITADLWVMIEVPRPWTKNPWQEEVAELLALFAALEKRPRLWAKTQILAIAPDRDYSRPGHRHVICYRRPSRLFAQYETHQYCVPTAAIANLIKALVFQPSHLAAFDAYQRYPVRSFFVCTHTHYDVACGRFGTPLYETLRRDYAADNELQVWQTAHFGGHNFAPTLIDFPVGQFWGHLDAGILATLVYRHGDVARLRPFYRGWSGLSRWGQIAEREVWMQTGWPWLAMPKTERIVAKDSGQWLHLILRWLLRWIPTIRAQVLLKKLDQKLNWAEVEIRVGEGKGQITALHRAKVEVSHRVMTQLRSGDAETLTP
ncbi:MAG: sucrase ferredoxin, partial [Cyanobacteria bacterium P01_H01_bin.58]